MTEDDEGHQHLWEPIPSWSGRYRCSACKTVGYRFSTVSGQHKPNKNAAVGPDHIEPYRCGHRDSAKAPTCGRWAVRMHGWGTKRWRCKSH